MATENAQGVPQGLRGTLVDSHCHLSCGQFDKDRPAAIERARAAGIDLIIEVGTMPENWPVALALSCHGIRTYVALGLHPHYVKDAPAGWRTNLEAAIGSRRKDNPYVWVGASAEAGAMVLEVNRVVAVGETGLDFYRDLSPREAQKEAFAAQLQVAADLDLPFVMHARSADVEVLDMLCAWKARLGRPLDGVWHCFSAGPKEAMAAVGLGLHLGFGGVMTYPRSEAVREAARITPADRLLLETDAPYVTPQAMRGKRNEPAFVAEVAKAMAEVRGTILEDVAATTTSNARHLFRI